MNSDYDDKRGPLLLKFTYYGGWLAILGLVFGLLGLFHPDAPYAAAVAFRTCMIIGLLIVLIRGVYWFRYRV